MNSDKHFDARDLTINRLIFLLSKKEIKEDHLIEILSLLFCLKFEIGNSNEVDKIEFEEFLTENKPFFITENNNSILKKCKSFAKKLYWKIT